MSVSLERSDRIVTVVQDRPDARNAVDPEQADRLQAVFLEFDADPDLDVAVLYGAGGAFCAGADPKSLAKRGIATAENATMIEIFGINFCGQRPLDVESK